MQVKVTRKEIENNYKNIISVGYCDLQFLLRSENPRYYTCGVYGWKADIYHINNNTVIVTGYAPFGNIDVERKIEKKFEEKARKICCDYSMTWQQQTKKLEKLLEKFINEVVKED